ncbi:replication restart helicase PriA [Pseudostreptobacillus sp.]
MYYQIYVKKRRSTYTYSSDKELEIGTYCEVDFAKSKLLGIVIRESKKEDIGDFKIKSIDKVLLDIPKIPKNILNLAIFINTYYITDFFASLALVGPYDKMSLESIKKLEIEDVDIKEEVSLSEKQYEIYNEIINSNESYFLLHGITGSGKTQIYIKLIIEALNRKKGSIFLVPEISLTTQMVNGLKKIFGDNISIIHSKMTPAKKKAEWEKIYSGKSKIVIGARSAIFAPVNNLGYIIMDEEHENTYKQEDNARYHTRNVALKRAMLEDCKVIFGSATPSFETYYYAQKGSIKLLELNERYNGATLPEVEVVNLEDEEGYLSKTLLKNMKETISKGEQVILILNRKSHSVQVKCHECNEKLKCPRCSVNLQYYKQINMLKCSHCEYNVKMYEKCPNCESSKFNFLGMGTEKLEEELEELFGKENILRMDSTTMKTNSLLKKAYTDFINQKYQILVGTQIVAKGFHFPNVTLVGVINSDQILQFSDFRAGEKTFQLVTQAAGRSGRGDKKGKVIIQTYNSDSNLIESIKNSDFKSYYNEDMSLRELVKLPPFVKYIKIIVSSKKEEKSKKQINDIYSLVYDKFDYVSQPDRANIYKLNDDYRNVIYIKTNNKEMIKNRSLLKSIKDQSNSSVRVLIDVDPLN